MGVLDREPTEHDSRADQRGCAPPIPHADAVETVHQGPQRQTGERKSGHIEGALFRFTRFPDIAKHHDDADDPERNVQKEYPSPGCIGCDEPAERRPENRRQQSGPSRDRRYPQEIAFLGAAQHNQPANGRHQSRRRALNHARRDEAVEIRSDATGDRSQREDADGAAEDRSRSEAVGQPAARRNEDRKRQHIGGDADTELDCTDAKRLRHARQRGRDHGTVERLHEEGSRDNQRDQRRPERMRISRCSFGAHRFHYTGKLEAADPRVGKTLDEPKPFNGVRCTQCPGIVARRHSKWSM